MLEALNITGGYFKEPKIHNVSLGFSEGEITTIIGPNGCGKSTFIKITAGLLEPFCGKVLLKGRELSTIKRCDVAKEISYLPQSRNTYNITVEKMVLHGRFPYLGYPRRYTKKDYEIAREAMKASNIFHLAHKNLSRISGGERQKAYIAMVIAQDTEIVFLDEPTTYLDISHQLEIMNMAKLLKERGKTVIMVLHDLNLALKNSDKIALMNKGEMIISGKPEDVYESGRINEAFGVSISKEETKTAGIQYFFRNI